MWLNKKKTLYFFKYLKLLTSFCRKRKNNISIKSNAEICKAYRERQKLKKKNNVEQAGVQTSQTNIQHNKIQVDLPVVIPEKMLHMKYSQLSSAHQSQI